MYEQAIGDLQEERTQTGEATAELAGQLRNVTESRRDDLKTIKNLRRENAQLAEREEEMTTTLTEKLTEAEAALGAVGELRSRNEVAALPTISDLGERAGSGMGTVEPLPRDSTATLQKVICNFDILFVI